MIGVVPRAALLALTLLGGCALIDPEAVSDSSGMTVGAGIPVAAAAETVAVGTLVADAADDPEIWVDPNDSSRAVIFGTDKQAGLYVYNLDGTVRQFIADGRLNNVDLRGGFPTPSGQRVLIAASDRDRLGIALYLMDPATLSVTRWGVAPLDLTEPYGLCMARVNGAFVVIVNGTDGQVRQVAIEAKADGAYQAREQRRFGLASQTEGCVADDVAGRLYIGEEAKGIWRYPLDPATPATGVLMAPAVLPALKPDVEGLTLLREGAATWLIASSQGDSAFAVWRVEGAAPVYAGRFSVVAGGGVDAVTGTDGVAALGGAVGGYPEGLVVMQDDEENSAAVPTGPGRQNYKLVGWREVKRALLATPGGPGPP